MRMHQQFAALLAATVAIGTADAQPTGTLGAPDTRTGALCAPDTRTAIRAGVYDVSAISVRDGKLSLLGRDRSIVVNWFPAGTYTSGDVKIVVRDQAVVELSGPTDRLMAGSTREISRDDAAVKLVPAEEPIAQPSTGLFSDAQRLGRVAVSSMTVARDGSLSLATTSGRSFRIPDGTYTTADQKTSLVLKGGRITQLVAR